MLIQRFSGADLLIFRSADLPAPLSLATVQVTVLGMEKELQLTAPSFMVRFQLIY